MEVCFLKAITYLVVYKLMGFVLCICELEKQNDAENKCDQGLWHLDQKN